MVSVEETGVGLFRGKDASGFLWAGCDDDEDGKG